LNANALVDKFCRMIGEVKGAENLENDVAPELIVSKEELQWAHEFMAEENIRKPIIWIHPGAGVPSRGIRDEKQWFPEKYAALITDLTQLEVGEFLIGGTKFERSIARRIQELLCVPIRSMMGIFELRQYAALLSISQLLITNDTGTMHIGGAVGVPTVAIFGPTGSKGKLPMNSGCVAVQSRVPCSPCTNFAFKGCLFDEFECMKEISVDRVLSAIDSLIGVTA
jgi:heptosyltransferase-2